VAQSLTLGVSFKECRGPAYGTALRRGLRHVRRSRGTVHFRNIMILYLNVSESSFVNGPFRDLNTNRRSLFKYLKSDSYLCRKVLEPPE